MAGKRIARKILSTAPNIGRGVSSMLFNAIIFLILKNKQNNELLLSYSWLLIITNFAVTFTGWGLRDYSVKKYVNDLTSFHKQFSVIISSKVPLIGIFLILLFLIPSGGHFKLWVILLVVLRTLLSLTDPLVLAFNKSRVVFFFESVVYLVALGFFIFSPNVQHHILHMLLFVDASRVAISFIIIFKRRRIKINYQKPYTFLYETRYYFAIAVFSFCMSRADVYVLGLIHKDNSFVCYNIILNLVAFSQIIIASAYNDSLKAIFRLGTQDAGRILNKLTLQFLILSALATVAIFGAAEFVYQIEARSWFYFLLFINVFCYCLTLKFLYILNHADQPRWFLIAAIFSSVANMSGALILIPPYGFYGALLANTIGIIILVSALYFFVQKNKILRVNVAAAC